MSNSIEERAGKELADLLGRLVPGQMNILTFSKQVDGEEADLIRLEVGQRAMLPEEPRAPVKAESPRRAHVFHDCAGFRAYLTAYKTSDTVVLADVSAGVMQVVLDEEADCGYEVLTFRPQIHPLFAAWEGILGKTLPILEFAKFAMENRRTVAVPDGKELAMLMSQVRVATKIDRARGKGQRAINGIMVEQTIQGQKHDEYVEFPDTIVIECPLYVGERASMRLEIDLVVYATDVEGSNICVHLSAADVLLRKTEAFELMLDAIAEVLEDGVTAFGKVGHADWSYLR